MNKPVEKPVLPTPIVQIRITLLSDGALNVNGFPTRLDAALAIMNDAQAAIIAHFVRGAKEGKLDENNAFEDKRILTPSNKVTI